MDRTVPAGAALLLNFIREVETGRADASAYDVIYGHKQGKLPKPITTMTVAELQGHQASGWPAKSTAAGGYQFMRRTLGDLRRELGLRDGQQFDPNLQDRLAYHLLKRRGYEQFVAGKLSVNAFALNLAKEWASLPVLVATKGSERQIKRGQSYYAGDGLNKALVKPEAIEQLLAKVQQTVAGFPVPPQPDIPHYPEPPATEPAKARKPVPRWVSVALALAMIGALAFVAFTQLAIF